MRFVPDASMTLAWFFDDERTDGALDVLRRLGNVDSGLVPPNWPLEGTNALLVGELRTRPLRLGFSQAVAALADLPIAGEAQPIGKSLFPIVEVARTHRLTTYDAAYLHLAMQARVPLATLDSARRRAASAAGVPLLPAANP